MKTPPSTTPVAFEPEFIEGLRALWEERIIFNQVLGLRITTIRPERVEANLAMRRELIGHFAHNRIHGGVISAALDAMAGLAIMAAIGARHMDETPARRLQRFTRLGTIDLRIDYLRPGVGEHFLMQAEVLRLGSRVANTRMAFLGADERVLAVGSAAYILA